MQASVISWREHYRLEHSHWCCELWHTELELKEPWAWTVQNVGMKMQMMLARRLSKRRTTMSPPSMLSRCRSRGIGLESERPVTIFQEPGSGWDGKKATYAWATVTWNTLSVRSKPAVRGREITYLVHKSRWRTSEEGAPKNEQDVREDGAEHLVNTSLWVPDNEKVWIASKIPKSEQYEVRLGHSSARWS